MLRESQPGDHAFDLGADRDYRVQDYRFQLARVNCTCANRIGACSAKSTIGHTGIPAETDATSA